MNRIIIAAFALGAAVLFPNWAAAHVVSRGDAPPLLEDDERERLTPIVHDCPQVPATFRAQDMTEDDFAEFCNVLKETEIFFHATMQSDPANPVRTHYSKVEIFAFSSVENLIEWYLEVYGVEPSALGGFHHSKAPPEIHAVVRQGYTGILEHEYIHYLDFRFIIPNGVTAGLGRIEGLAEYLLSEREGSDALFSYIKVIGDGSDLIGPFQSIWGPQKDKYSNGYLVMYYLFERHPKVITGMAENMRTSSTAYYEYINEVLPPLADDFLKWQKEFIPLTIAQIEPISLFGHQSRWIQIDRYFRTSRIKDITSLSLSVPHRQELYETEHVRLGTERTLRAVSDIVTVESYDAFISEPWGREHGYFWNQLHLYSESVPGTVEVTVTATTRDGESAEQAFTVTVVAELETKAIVPDPVDIEDGETAIDLASYYTGPALSDIEFTAISNNLDVAHVLVRGGRLIITAVSAGEADITLRTDYNGEETEQTFTITVTDVCPSCVTVTAESPLGVVIFQEVDDDGSVVHDGTWAVSIRLRDYFASSQQLTYSVSLSVPYETYGDGPWFRSQILYGSVQHETLLLSYRSRPGTVEVTVTAIAPNGDSAELTFIVNVVQGLRTRDIAVHDVSTVEGETAIDLSAYFTGPALSAIEFTAESNDTDVALVTVLGGRLVITAVSAGEAEVTVRSEYYDTVTTQTFMITVTDDCPSWLCRGFFNGWRWLLLEDEQATPATEAE